MCASSVVPNKYVQQSPVDFDHVLKADYTKKGKPTGGHTLLYGDVRIVPGTESVPDVAGVYKATIQVPDPANPGQWITKTSNNSTNTMFPKEWDEIRVKTEVDAAWNDPNKIVQGDKWISVTPSGVKVEGWISPRTTVYPVYQSPKKP
ncbi:EndoU domain-containing protein [Motiliproteus sp. MSK22-1]|uniref:EndoU domain-containing protein n=1 Tax=Motiliproteus sp. MSK22-1 TaxID=1897630 RepID=UPI000976B23F|nr:EndoU domain-containing protein [Motiliproteus sp. MSK22-1]